MSDADPPKPVTKRPRPKYQVFVSSTYDDLHDERREATWEILKAGHIPAGMENFTATDERGWQIIRRTIDRSDYYVVLVAGRYGSVDATTGLSWTEREYKYARERAIPVLAFVRQDDHILTSKAETDPALQAKLAKFKTSLRGDHLCDRWGNVDDLRAKLAQAVRQHIQDDEDNGTARPGWYRGDEVPASTNALEEFARLSVENDRLRRRLATLESADVEILELVRGDGSAVGDVEQTYRTVVVVEDRDDASHSSMMLRAMRNIDEPALDEVQTYADDVERTVWCSLKVLNKGTKPARHVVADFWITGAKVFVDSIPKPSALPEIPENRWCFDATEHVYVESIDRTDVTMAVRQRITQVAVGGSESLITMGFRPLMGDATRCVASVRYEVRSEDGVVATGSFKVVQQAIGEKPPMTRKEVLAQGDD